MMNKYKEAIEQEIKNFEAMLKAENENLSLTTNSLSVAMKAENNVVRYKYTLRILKHVLEKGEK